MHEAANPVGAAAPEGRTRRRMRQYFELLNRGDVEGLVSSFSVDGIVDHADPDLDPKVVAGADALRGYFGQVVSRHPVVDVVEVFTDGDRGVVRLEAVADGAPRTEMASVFTMTDDGLIRRLDHYSRGVAATN